MLWRGALRYSGPVAGRNAGAGCPGVSFLSTGQGDLSGDAALTEGVHDVVGSEVEENPERVGASVDEEDGFGVDAFGSLLRAGEGEAPHGAGKNVAGGERRFFCGDEFGGLAAERREEFDASRQGAREVGGMDALGAAGSGNEECVSELGDECGDVARCRVLGVGGQELLEGRRFLIDEILLWVCGCTVGIRCEQTFSIIPDPLM